MKRSWKALLGALCVYLLMLLLLVASESKAPGASIRSLGDALWYSIITLTTVGYGDITPVTPAGRALGLLFALCSVGVLAAMVALGVRLLSGELLPLLRLRLSRARPWYVFATANPQALALAASLRREDESALMLFPADAQDAPADAVRTVLTPERLSRLHGEKGLYFLFMGCGSLGNYARALRCAQMGLYACCMSELSPSRDAPASLHVFSPEDALSRRYWQRFPLAETERRLVLIGSGPAAEMILARALLTNVFPAPRTIEYHCFGFGGEFACLHRELVRSLSAGGDDGDLLVFHEEAWFEDGALLQDADRVILCSEDDEENLRLFEKLRGFCVLRGRVHLRLSERAGDLPAFGCLDETLTAENVLREELDRRAHLLNDIYNRNAAVPHTWQELTPFQRQSNIAAADHLNVKLRILLGSDAQSGDYRLARARFDALDPDTRELYREPGHRRWLRFHRLYNWRAASGRDNALRLHPLLVPYSELSQAEREKDDYAWLLLGELDRDAPAG